MIGVLSRQTFLSWGTRQVGTRFDARFRVFVAKAAELA
jgi:hypothetical protein